MTKQWTIYSQNFPVKLAIYSILIALFEKQGSVGFASSSPLEYVVPSFSLLELRSSRRIDDLASALTTSGIIAVTGMDGGSSSSDSDFSASRLKAFRGLCGCMTTSGNDIVGAVDNADRSLLSDGITSRSSIATATINGTPLPLPKEPIERMCGIEVPEAMEALRDYVSHVTDTFLGSLDRLLRQSFSLEHPESTNSHDSNNFLLRTVKGKKFTSVKTIVDSSQNLEHFHVYSKPFTPISPSKSTSSNASTTSLELIDSALSAHIDAGLFLSFVPAYSCGDVEADKNTDLSFYVNVDGETKHAILPPNSVILMLGAGAEYWLQLPGLLPLRATRHAVRMREGSIRAWYGMMHLVPEDAIIQEFPRPSTFADMRQLMSARSSKRTYSETNPLAQVNAAIGCGISDQDKEKEANMLSTGDEVITKSAITRSRRRLDMVPDASYCNNSTNFYCWMSCLDIPEYKNAAKNVKSGESLYCLDPSALSSGDVSEAVLPCDNPKTGTPGGAMNSNCIGSWQPTATGVPAQEVVINSTQPAIAEQYCYGSTSMFMQGFQWHGDVCVVYLFPSWVLTTSWKMLIACFGTMLLGASLEGIICARRLIVRQLPKEHTRILVSTLVYGWQLTLAYFIMLIVMTYSGPLFLSVILGLMLGHSVFSVIGNKGVSVDEGATPCCVNAVAPLNETAEDVTNSCGSSEKDVLSEDKQISYETYSNDTLTAIRAVPVLENLIAGENKSCCCDIESY